MVRNILTSLQQKDEVHFWENRPFSGTIPESRRCKPEETRKTIKKKTKRIRTAYTTEQIRALELIFTQSKYITPETRREVSKSLKIGDKSVKIWFQNRRMKEKRESSESGSDSSENVTDFESVATTIATKYPDSLQSIDKQSIGMETILSPKENQYQVPYYYNYNVSDAQNLNVQASDYSSMQNNCMQYYNESNLYPTEYYPCNEGNYTTEYNNYYYCQPENVMHNMQIDYWNLDKDASCYFYN